MKAAALVAFLALAVSPVSAQDVLREKDAARLAAFETTLGRALIEALAAGAPRDVAALTTALSGRPDIAFDETLAGAWKCRTIRLGGQAALVVYTPFDCRFEIAGGGFRFEKLSGSERTKGTIQLRDGRAIYIGVGFGAGENPPEDADLQSDDSIQSQIAVFERINPTRARLLFPSPAANSEFDILELTR